MLNAKFKRAGWLAQSLLLITIPCIGNILQNDSSGKVFLQAKDTAIIQLNVTDSLQAFAVRKMYLNKTAEKFVTDFLKKNKITLQKVELRSKSSFDLIDSVFIKYDLPLQLKYLAVVESKLKTTAVSRVGATGLWQFMPSTAKRMGLKITSKYDERKNAYKSTVAAAKYLTLLHGYLNDWLLVVAAYNSGLGNVYKAIKKSGSRDFWKLQHHLPAETRLHVKRFIGTHSYFEKEVSLVVLTKAEANAYIKLADGVENQNR